MNSKRKTEIQKIADAIEEQRMKLEDILNEEQEYYDNVPENLQGTERYEQSEQAISNLEDAISDLENINNSLTEIVEN